MDQEQEGQSSEPAAAETTFSQPTSKESSPERTDCSLQNTPSPIAKLMARTGYSIVQQNGQRRYGPPPDWDGPPPPRGCEIFVGKIPRDCFEDELVPVFEKVGRIYEMRLMMDFSGQNRGYAFVVYGNPLEAKDSLCYTPGNRIIETHQSISIRTFQYSCHCLLWRKRITATSLLAVWLPLECKGSFVPSY